MALDMALERLGARLIEEERHYELPDHEHDCVLTGTVDAVAVQRATDEALIVEIKCYNSAKARRCGEGEWPREARAQVQWYLYLSGYETGYLVALDYDAWDVHILRVERDEGFIAELLESARLYASLVLLGISPVEALWASPPAESSPGAYTPELESDLSTTISVLAGVERQIVDLEAQKSELRELVLRAWPMDGDRPYQSVEHHTGLIRLVGKTERRTVDSKLLRDKHPDVAMECEKISIVAPSIRCNWKKANT
jgi:hypothetical protein